MRIGVFGGSFDPVHVGHLLLGEFCREQAGLDEVWFVPVSQAPHKRSGPIADSKHRIEMLRLATWGHECFRVSEVEVERGGISFTVDTLEQFHAEYPSAEFCFLMGADSLNDFGSWKDPQRICQLATPLVVVRGGERDPNWSILDRLVDSTTDPTHQKHRIDFPAIDLSSSEIRKRVVEGRSIRYQTPRAVEQYIKNHGLYAAPKG